MTDKTITYIMTGVSYAALAGLLLWIPFRIKQLKKECGQLIMKLRSDMLLRSIATFIVCGLLIAVVPVRNFALYLAFVFDVTAVLAAWMASKDLANSGMNGVFENMIISDTTAIRYTDILSLPTVAYEKDPDTTQVDFTLLEVIPKAGAKIQLIFPDEATRNMALEAILKQCPALGQ